MEVKMRLEIRRNNAYDTLILIEDGRLVGDWTLTPDVYHNFINHGDLEDWEANNLVGWQKPEDFGDEVIAYVEQSFWRSDQIDWIGFGLPRKGTK